ncbi:MAG: Gar1/Naf1 family protein [Candidatus Nezhaarchaeales archaeon]
MRRLGRVIAFTGRRKLIVKSRFTPSLGASIYDRSGIKIGSVFDIFGSVKEPYVSISLDKGVEGASLVNCEVFVDVKKAKVRGRDG